MPDRIAVCTPVYGGNVHVEMMRSVLAFCREHEGATFHTNTGSFLPAQRNGLVVDALTRGAEWILWWDADVAATNVGALLETAKLTGADIVGALVASKPAACDGYGIATDDVRCSSALSPDAPAAFDIMRPRYEHLRNVTGACFMASPGETALAATSLMLTRADVYARVEPPWFSFVERAPGQHPWPEDWHFCLRAQRAGVRVAFDTRPTTRHYGMAGWAWASNTHPTVRSYAAEIGESLRHGESANALRLTRELAADIEQED